MKNKIAITACLKRCSIAIQYNGKIYTCNEDIDATTYLVSLVDKLLKKYDINLKNMQELITISGPGSFTGIRIAQSFIKGLSFVLKIPIKCTNYFDVIHKLSYVMDNNCIAIIKSEGNQYYFHNFSNNHRGVSPIYDLLKNIPSSIIFAGEIPEIIEHSQRKFIKINDFRNAKHLLNIKISNQELKPIYINIK